MLIPERTIDAWISQEIFHWVATALLWCPTTNAQRTPGLGRPAGTAPWDGAVDVGRPGCSRKLFMLENKGLAGGPSKVNLNKPFPS
jgi:hypothetical protein